MCSAEQWKMWRNILSGMTIWRDYRIQKSDRTSVLRYAHFLSLRTSQHPLNISLTIHISYTAQPLFRYVIIDHLSCTSEHVLIDCFQFFVLQHNIFFLVKPWFRTTRNENRFRSEDIWPNIQPCIFTNSVSANTHVRNYALHKWRSPIHQLRYSKFALTNQAW
jgi:hypothetical protein